MSAATESIGGVPVGLVQRGFAPTNDRCNWEQCGSCGADIGVSPDFLWHLPDDDCRAIREPVTADEYGRIRQVEREAMA